MVLQAELKDAPLRWNNVCIHFGVSEFGGSINQLGMPSCDTRELGPTFVGLATSDARKGTICLATIDEAKALAKELGQ